MKVIKTDNFEREEVSEVLIAEGVSEFWAERIVTALNKTYSGMTASDYFKVKPDDYKLYVFLP